MLKINPLLINSGIIWSAGYINQLQRQAEAEEASIKAVALKHEDYLLKGGQEGHGKHHRRHAGAFGGKRSQLVGNVVERAS